MPGRDALQRLGLLASGLVLLETVLRDAMLGPLAVSVGWVWLSVGLGIAGLLVVASAGLRRVPQRVGWLALLAAWVHLMVISGLWLVETNTRRNLPSSNRATLVLLEPGLRNAFGARLLLGGENPLSWDYALVSDLAETPGYHTAYHPNGSEVSGLFTPILPVYLSALLDALGLPGTFALGVGAMAMIYLVLVWQAPSRYRALVLVPILLSTDLHYQVLAGSLDSVWVLFLLLAMATWGRPLVSAGVFGLALAAGFPVWLCLPFVVLHLLQTHPSPRTTLVYVAVAIGVFGILHLPLGGVPLPAWSVIPRMGAHLGGLVANGRVMWPFWFFGAAGGVVLVGGLMLAWRTRGGLLFWAGPMAVLIVWPLVSMRFEFWLLVVLAALIHGARAYWDGLSVVITGGVVALVVVMGIVFRVPASATVTVDYPMEIDATGNMVGLNVTVTNPTNTPLEPRFFLQDGRFDGQVLPWEIKAGPRLIAPGQAEAYRLMSIAPSDALAIFTPSVLAVWDATGQPLANTVIPAERSLVLPDAIPDPSYRVAFWNGEQLIPAYWSLRSNQSETTIFQSLLVDGKQALQVNADALPNELYRANVETRATLPREPVHLWAYPPPDPTAIYGVEVDDGDRRLVIRFGDGGEPFFLDRNTYVVRIAAPLGRWTRHTLDFEALYTEAGFPLPPYSDLAVNYSVQVPRRVVILRHLYVSSTPDEAVEIVFGGWEQADTIIAPRELMQDTIMNRAAYQTYLVAFYVERRNFERAQAALNDVFPTADETTQSILTDLCDTYEQLICEGGRGADAP